MAEVLYPAQRLVIAVFRFENYKTLKLAYDPGLPGYAELRRKIAPYPGDGFQCVAAHSRSCSMDSAWSDMAFTVMWKNMLLHMLFVRS